MSALRASHLTRSKGAGRLTGKEPSLAGSYAAESASSRCTNRSPTQASKLPVKKVNKTASGKNDLGRQVITPSHPQQLSKCSRTNLNQGTEGSGRTILPGKSTLTKGTSLKVGHQSQQLEKLQSLEKEISASTEKTVAQMNDLIDVQREQLNTFNSGASQLQKEWKKEVLAEVDKRLERIENEKRCQSLKDQAF